MGRTNHTPYRARRSARLIGSGLGRVSVLISKTPRSLDKEIAFKKHMQIRKPVPAVVDKNNPQDRQDITQSLPDALVEEILRDLSPSDVRTCSAVCKRWKALSEGPTVWKPLCEVRAGNWEHSTPY